MKETSSLEKLISYDFKDISFLRMALVHPSYGHENNEKDNQRLEFLGDAVLDLVIAQMTYDFFPQKKEGFLTQCRSSLVNQKSLAKMARELGLQEYVLLPEKDQKNRRLDSTLSDLMEAIIGAVFLDGGYFSAKDLIYRWFEPIFINDDLKIIDKNFKGKLQELSQQMFAKIPEYKVVSQLCENNENVFVVEVSVGRMYAMQGSGLNKKGAEQDASEKLYFKLKEDL
ncbi:ribonuclease III [PVC group bacterium (ex Bugula neritina AB1)]|nr:ribonuclease III [PVC group bacterium (ex Bugula neritina AB1)]